MTKSQVSNLPTHPAITRRQFLKIIAASATAGVMLKGGWDAWGQVEKVSESRLLMGTLVNLTILAAPAGDARAAVLACLNRMAELEQIFSRFQPESQLSQLNQVGFLENASPEMLQVLALSHQVSLWSNGAFDITIKPLVDLYFANHTRMGALPSSQEVDEARQLVDYRRIQVNSKQVTLSQPGMSLTMDGIAKGYIVDAGVAKLRELGFTNVLVEAGGDLVTCGEEQPGKHGWQVGIQSPRSSRPGIIERLSTSGQAIATSGDYQQTFTPDFTHHHIIDPRTGYSGSEIASATVTAPTAALADALATSAMVMSVTEGKNLIEKLPGCEALLITKGFELIRTSGFPVSN